MPPTAVFLDMDGVLVDQTKLPLEYQRLLGEVLAPALGGTIEDWGRANAEAFPKWFALLRDLPSDEDPIARYDREDVLSIRAMCEVLGFPPPGEEECIRLGRASDTYVRTHHQAFLPEVASTIRELADTHTIHFATGNPSWNIEVAMERMALTDSVGLLCGPDLVGVLKQSTRFYPALFELAGVAPSEAVVVDDSAAQLATAAALGASTVLVSAEGAANADVDAVITTIGELPRALAGL